MEGMLVRTSVTIDEAVAMMLGWTQGPIVYASDLDLSPEVQEELDNVMFHLEDELEQRQISCENDLEDAEGKGQPAAVIAEKQDALKKHKEIVRLANTYLCAVRDELNKGEHSALRVDNAFSTYVGTYITLTSLDDWARSRFGKDILPKADVPIPSIVGKKTEQSAARTRLRDQEKAVLQEIERLGYQPSSIPLHQYNQPGVKAAVMKTLVEINPLFPSEKSFKKTWERLRQERSIADSKDSPPK